jgi:hypothetical protein
VFDIVDIEALNEIPVLQTTARALAGIFVCLVVMNVTLFGIFLATLLCKETRRK